MVQIPNSPDLEGNPKTRQIFWFLNGQIVRTVFLKKPVRKLKGGHISGPVIKWHPKARLLGL
jgi:hypothetical protein